MSPSANRTLRFDRFTLDLTRGRLWAGGREIDLRPKTFEVLRHLAENAGRLVPKQELFVAIWPDVAVTDDSLVQCIRELRDRLGDTDRRLIKTVHRRGYLLDTTLTIPQAHSRRETSLETSGAKGIAPVSLFFARHWKLFSGVAATILLFLALGAIYSPKLVAHAPYAQNDLAALPEAMRTPIIADSYSQQVARRVSQLAVHQASAATAA